jgi:hypothetical protein
MECLGWGGVDEDFEKKVDWGFLDGAALVDERERTDWKCISHVGDAPRVAMEDTWMTMWNGNAVLLIVGSMGIVESISWRPSQPKDV